MERLTILSNDHKTYLTKVIEGSLDDEAYCGEAIQKLATFENMHAYLIKSQTSIPKELERLRMQGKSKTVTFKELLTQKLINESMLMLLSRYGIE